MSDESGISRPDEKDSNPQPTISATVSPINTAQGAASSPSAEEQRYWAQDLFIKKLGLCISAGGFIIIIVGLFVTYRQLTINTEQLRLSSAQSEKTAKAIRANVENAVVTHVTSLDRLFIEKPFLTPYFYAEKQISENDPNYPEVSAVAVMVLDVFDLVATQNKHYPEFWDTPEAWDEWMIDVFSNSPILRKFIDTHPKWYGVRVKSLREKARERTGR